MKNIKWFTMVALVVLAVASYYEWYWVWGVLFVFWAATSIQGGQAFIVENIGRRQNPVLFWLITAMWGGFGAWYVWADLTWRLA